MDNQMNKQDKSRLVARLAYTTELVSIQSEQLEKGLLEIVDLSEKLGFNTDSIASIRKMASIISLIKGLRNGEK